MKIFENFITNCTDSVSKETASGFGRVIILSSGLEMYHALPLYLERLKGSLSNRFILNPSINLYQDIKFTISVLIILLIARCLISGIYYKNKILFKSPFYFFATNIKTIKPHNYQRFSETLWLFLWHFSSFCWCLFCLSTQLGTAENPMWVRMFINDFSPRWFWMATKAEFDEGIIGWPYINASFNVRTFYLVELAFWMSCLIIIFFEIKRKDFKIMFVHHLSTCLLISLSYMLSFWRIGQFILLFHDIADIFLYSAKCLNYCNPPVKVTDTFYALFMLAFFISRLFLYPVVCVFPIVNTKILSRLTCGEISSYWDIPGYIFFPFFLLLLLVLHVYWFYLIARMAYTLILYQYIYKEKPLQKLDPRSDDEEDVDTTNARWENKKK